MLILSIKVRNLLSLFSSIPNSQQTQIAVLNDNIEWAKREKRIFLKQSLETRLISLWVSDICRCRLLLSVIIVVFAKAIGDSAIQTRTRIDRGSLDGVTEIRRQDDPNRGPSFGIARLPRDWEPRKIQGACVPSRLLAYLKSHLLVLVNLRTYCCELNLLPASTPSCLGLAIRNFTRGGQRLHDCLLLLL
jgi:26S proteasome regulatory subunit RPN6 N-terminal domain